MATSPFTSSHYEATEESGCVLARSSTHFWEMEYGEVAATGMMLSCEHWTKEATRNDCCGGQCLKWQWKWGEEQFITSRAQKAAKSCNKFSPSQMSSKRGQKNKHWMGSDTAPSEVSEGGKGRGKNRRKKISRPLHWVIPELLLLEGSQILAGAFASAFFPPLSENQEVKAPNLDVYLKYSQILPTVSPYSVLHLASEKLVIKSMKE